MVGGKCRCIRASYSRMTCTNFCARTDGFAATGIMEREIKQLNPSTESQGKQPFQQNRVYDADGISVALCAEKAGQAPMVAVREAAVLHPVRNEYGKEIRKDYESGAVKVKRAEMRNIEPRTDGKSNTLTTVQKDNHLLTEEIRVRRLTPTECARLQTIPDWYEWVVSNSQQYKMLGNGWTVEVIKHIFSFLPDELKQPIDKDD